MPDLAGPKAVGAAAPPNSDVVAAVGQPWQIEYVDGLPADLRPDKIAKSVRRTGGRWDTVSVSERLESTNAELMARAARGEAADGLSLVCDEQTAGRGRLDRSWVAPPGTAALFSVVARPGPGPHEFAALPLLCGVAICEAIESVCEVPVGLKWPNDVMVTGPLRPGKVAGILVEREPRSGALVIGCGINVTMTEFPTAVATSLALAGAARFQRSQLIGRALARLQHWCGLWDAARGNVDQLLEGYRARCITVGQRVRVERPGGSELVGLAHAIGPRGELMVKMDGAPPGASVPVIVGDIVHLRLA